MASWYCAAITIFAKSTWERLSLYLEAAAKGKIDLFYVNVI